MEHRNHTKKQKKTLQYIHKEFSHPPNIIKQIPMTIETRLSNHSSNETVFHQTAEEYEKALKKSCYNVKLEFKSEFRQQNESQKKYYLVQSAV